MAVSVAVASAAAEFKYCLKINEMKDLLLVDQLYPLNRLLKFLQFENLIGSWILP